MLKAIILAGGFGTRLQSVVKDLPKPLAPINEKPFLFYLIKYLKQEGIKEIHLSIHYLAEKIIEAFKDEDGIYFHVEKKPLGTGGAILNVLNHVNSSHVLILNGDSFGKVNIMEMLNFHNKKNSKFTISAVEMQNTERFGRLEINKKDRITGFIEKTPNAGKGYINTGIYIANTKELKKDLEIINKQYFSLEKDFLEINKDLFAFKNQAYFIDIGIPEDYERAKIEIPDKLKRKALFLDRDGVINSDEKKYTYKIEEFEFIEGIFDFCKSFQEKNYLIFVITNQSGIARGYYTLEDFKRLTIYMESEFQKHNIYIAKTYFCPFHVDGKLPEFSVISEDRKPNPGMILKACQEFYLDLSNSILVGDQETDIEAGKRAGIGKNLLFAGSFQTILGLI